MYPAIVSGIITGEALISYWPIFFRIPSNSPRTESLPALARPSFLVSALSNDSR